jgi:Zn-dependent M28 family amino/carboxypeptidase
MALLILLLAVMAWCTVLPSCADYPPTEAELDPAALRAHVVKLAVDFAPRDYRRIWNLNKSADYISEQFSAVGAIVSEQTFEVKGQLYRNIIARFGPETDSRIVVGAHYDSHGDTPGADDNASGVAGLIELAGLLGQVPLSQRVDLAAFTLEEPPFFGSGNMGSARHAYRLRQDDIDVEAMLCLEMIGCFSDEENSQDFPSMFLRMLYPSRGNYISLIGSLGDQKLIRQVKDSMRCATALPVHSMTAPKGFPGLDFSDHRNFWNNGYTAIMITDTAFYRNHRYHGLSDTVDTLDYDRMAQVVLGIYEAVVRLANDED